MVETFDYHLVEFNLPEQIFCFSPDE